MISQNSYHYHLYTLLIAAFLLLTPCVNAQELKLRDNLKQAKAGDFLVTAQGKNYAILIIKEAQNNLLSIEEITVPSGRISTKAPFSWRKWIEEGAKGNTCWILYNIDLNTATIQQAFSYSRNEWIKVPESQNFLSTLLNLKLEKIPDSERKKVGPAKTTDTADRRSIWQPALVVDGQTIPGVLFDGWKTRWPKDGGELSGKQIEVYLPSESTKYPSYFPYWLQVNGMIGKAKVRIIDSGSGLQNRK